MSAGGEKPILFGHEGPGLCKRQKPVQFCRAHCGSCNFRENPPLWQVYGIRLKNARCKRADLTIRQVCRAEIQRGQTRFNNVKRTAVSLQ